MRLETAGGNTPLNHTKFPLASLNESRKEDRGHRGALPQNTPVPGVSYDITGSQQMRLAPSYRRHTSAQHDLEMKSQIAEGLRYGVSTVAPTEQAAAEELTAEAFALVDAAVRERRERASIAGEIGMLLDSRKGYDAPLADPLTARLAGLPAGKKPFTPGILDAISKNALMRFDRMARR